MSTTAAPEGQGKLVDVPSNLPKIDGFEIAQLRLAVGGGIELPLSDKDHRDLLARLKLDAEVTVSIAIEGRAPIELVGAVVKHEEKLIKREGSHVGLAVRRISINRESTSWDEGESAAEGGEG